MLFWTVFLKTWKIQNLNMQNNQTIRELTMQNTPVGHAGFVNSSCCSDQLASMLAEKLAS